MRHERLQNLTGLGLKREAPPSLEERVGKWGPKASKHLRDFGFDSSTGVHMIECRILVKHGNGDIQSTRFWNWADDHFRGNHMIDSRTTLQGRPIWTTLQGRPIWKAWAVLEAVFKENGRLRSQTNFKLIPPSGILGRSHNQTGRIIISCHNFPDVLQWDASVHEQTKYKAKQTCD